MMFTPEIQAAIAGLIVAILTVIAAWVKSKTDKTEKDIHETIKDSVKPLNDSANNISEQLENLESIRTSLESIARDLHDISVQGRYFNKLNS